jgi:hypothetical protein
MRGTDSSVRGTAGQFHTPRWAMVMVTAGGPSQSVSLVLCDSPIAAEGELES